MVGEQTTRTECLEKGKTESSGEKPKASSATPGSIAQKKKTTTRYSMTNWGSPLSVTKGEVEVKQL